MPLLDMISSVSGAVKLQKGEKANIDNAIFKLHYRGTTALLFIFSMLVTANSLIGNPVNCVYEDPDKISEDVINTYCWIHSTFTLPKHYDNPKAQGKSIAYPGVGTHKRGDDHVYHAYYQWVPFFLFFQGVLFYIPHWLWKAWEDRKVSSILDGLLSPILDPDSRKSKVSLLSQYVYDSLHSHNMYLLRFVICEFLNLFNVIGNIWLVDKFLGGTFLKYGVQILDFIQMEQENRTDPMIEVFPRMTKCTFNLFGPSGTVQQYDALCVMALNIINEKVYVILWFWFIVVAVLSTFAVMYRCLVLSIPAVRMALLQRHAHLTYPTALQVIRLRSSIGDHFLLSLLAKNMDNLAFRALLVELAGNLNGGSSVRSKEDGNSIIGSGEYRPFNPN